MSKSILSLSGSQIKVICENTQTIISDNSEWILTDDIGSFSQGDTVTVIPYYNGDMYSLKIWSDGGPTQFFGEQSIYDFVLHSNSK